jgi:hypothetical protein
MKRVRTGFVAQIGLRLSFPFPLFSIGLSSSAWSVSLLSDPSKAKAPKTNEPSKPSSKRDMALILILGHRIIANIRHPDRRHQKLKNGSTGSPITVCDARMKSCSESVSALTPLRVIVSVPLYVTTAPCLLSIIVRSEYTCQSSSI